MICGRGNDANQEMNVGKMTIGFGIALILLGVIGFAATGAKTAMIPAYFGVPIALCGVIAQLKPGARLHAMHVAVLVGLLAFVGSLVMVIKGFGKIMKDDPAARPVAVTMQAIMLVIAGVFVALCVRSFTSARRARLASNSTG